MELTVLKKSRLFSALTPECIAQEILPLGQLREYPRGVHLIAPQEQLRDFGVILSGRVRILHIFEDGSESLSTVLGPGGVLGADLVATKSRVAPYHAVAAAPTRLLSIPPEAILSPGRLSESTRLEILGRLLALISQDNMKKEYRFAILSRKGLRQRIITYLSMQSGKRGTNDITIPFSREELASFLCVNRSALSHELSLMQQEGLIRFRKNRFQILHPELWREQT